MKGIDKFTLSVVALMLAPALICAAGLAMPFEPGSPDYQGYFAGNYMLMTIPHYLLLVAYFFVPLRRSTFIIQLVVATVLLGLLRVLILKFVPGREAPIAWIAHYPLWIVCTGVCGAGIYWRRRRRGGAFKR